MSYVPPYLAGVQPPTLSTNSISALTNTVSSAGTLVLSNLSNQNQVISGTSVHTVTLPAVSTLVAGQSFVVTNTSTGLVHVVSSGNNTVSVLRPQATGTFTCISTTGTASGSWSGGNVNAYTSTGLYFCSDGTSLWITRPFGTFANTVARVSIATGELISSTATNPGPHGIVYDGTNVWVTCYAVGTGTTVQVLSGTSGVVIQTIVVPTTPAPICFDGVHVWVGCQSGSLRKYRASDYSLVSSVSIPGNVNGLCTDGTFVYATFLSTNLISKYRIIDSVLVASYGLGGANSPARPTYDGMDLWIPCNSGAIVKMTTSGTILATFTGLNGSICAFDGKYVWGINSTSATFTRRYDIKTGAFEQYNFNATTTGVLFDGTNIWLASDRLYKVTPAATGITGAAVGVPLLSTFNPITRDLYAGTSINNVTPGFQRIATAVGTTIMSAISGYNQIFTGVTTQTVLLPPVSALSNGCGYKLTNLSTGAVTVQTSGGGAVTVLSPFNGGNSWAVFTCIDITGATGIGGWGVEIGGVAGTIRQLITPSNTNAAAINIPLGGFYSSALNTGGSPDILYIRTV